MCLSYLSVSKHSDVWEIVCELQGILLSDDTTDSDTDSDDSDFTMTREELQDMLRLHKFTKLHQSKFHSDREVRHACWVWDSCPRINSFMETVGNCVCVHSCSTINTTALVSCPLTTHSTSSSATYWASRKRKSRKRRNVRVSLQNKRGCGSCFLVIWILILLLFS